MMSHVLQWTQFEKFTWSLCLPAPSPTISYTLAGQKFWQGLPYSSAQRVDADVRVHDLQVRRLVLVVMRPGVIDVRQLVEDQLVVVLQVPVPLVRRSRRELLHVLVARFDREP